MDYVNPPPVIAAPSMTDVNDQGRLDKSSDFPVAQIKESHTLKLDPATSRAGAIAIVPPYPAMAINDKIIFTWQGHFQGQPEHPHSDAITLKAEHLGQPLKFDVPAIEIIGIQGEHAIISYRVEYAGAEPPGESERQTIDIVKPVSALLPELAIKDYTGGPVSPGRYPDGLVLQIKTVDTGIQEGDWVLVYWTGSESAKSVTKAVRVDRSTLDNGDIEFTIEPQWLTANAGARVTVSYQYARAGHAESGEPRQLEISKPLYLPAPPVEDVTPVGENRGDLQANTSGAYVTIPQDAETGASHVEVHWEGNPNGGRGSISVPVGGSGRRFHVPPALIAANMSTDESARFPVTYTVTPPGDKSTSFNLLIEPLPRSQYPNTQCTQAMGSGTLRLSSVPLAGADLTITQWPFIAIGQKLTIQATGISHGSTPVSITVRDKKPVTSDEFYKRKIEEKLLLNYLKSLKLNEQFTIRVWVSFDSGETLTPFNDTRLTLVS